MNFDIQKSLREMAEEASSSVSFEQVWDQFKGNTKKKGHLPYQRLRRGIACVAASVLGIVGCGLGLSIVFPSVALAMDKTPIANQVYDWLGDPGLSRTTVFDDKVHVSAIDHGITFTVNDIYDDQGRIALQYQINTSKGTLGKTAIAPEMKFYLKGKPLNLTTGGEAGGVSAQSWHGFNEIFPVSSNETLPKKFDLQIVIHQIGNTRGYWEVQIPVSGEKEFTKTRTISSSVSKTYEGTTLGIDDVTITPATVIVEYHYTFAQGQNTNIFLNASSNHAVLLPNLAGATYHSISDGIETVYAFAMFDRPDSLGDNMKILPENVPSSSSISTELKNLDISVPLN